MSLDEEGFCIECGSFPPKEDTDPIDCKECRIYNRNIYDLAKASKDCPHCHVRIVWGSTGYAAKCDCGSYHWKFLEREDSPMNKAKAEWDASDDKNKMSTYKRLSLLLHPDKHPKDDEVMKALNGWKDEWRKKQDKDQAEAAEKHKEVDKQAEYYGKKRLDQSEADSKIKKIREEYKYQREEKRRRLFHNAKTEADDFDIKNSEQEAKEIDKIIVALKHKILEIDLEYKKAQKRIRNIEETKVKGEPRTKKPKSISENSNDGDDSDDDTWTCPDPCGHNLKTKGAFKVHISSAKKCPHSMEKRHKIFNEHFPKLDWKRFNKIFE